MSNTQRPGQVQDPIYLVRAIGRMAHMLLEMRDEYIQNPSSDALDQIERRLDELGELGEQLREMRASNDEADTMSEFAGN